MDEAELLSDRVAVLKDGVLQCSGTPLFLKTRYGLGYNLTVVLEPLQVVTDSPRGDDHLGTNEPISESYNQTINDGQERLVSFLQRYIPGAQLARKFGKELYFRLPKGSERLFPAAFDALELERRSMGVGAFGVANASLEEVFLLLGDSPELMSPRTFEEDSDSKGPAPDDAPIQKPPSLFGQIGLLYWKRLTIQKRDLKGAFFSLIVPVLLVGLVLLVLTINVPLVGPAIEVSPSLYRKSSTDTTAVTDVLVAGQNVSSGSSRYANMASLLMERYPWVHPRRLEEASSSGDVSSHLLATYNEPHNSRYAAYVINDIINTTIAVDWDDLDADINALSEDQAVDDLEPIRLVQFLSDKGDPSRLRRIIYISDVSDDFYSSTGLTANATANAVSA
jgi:hypothetical protein